jgi:hypothetical protein
LAAADLVTLVEVAGDRVLLVLAIVKSKSGRKKLESMTKRRSSRWEEKVYGNLSCT